MKPITVNGKRITETQIAEEMQHHPAANPHEAKRLAVEALVIRELLLQEADRLAISADPVVDPDGRRETDEDSRIRRLIEDQVVSPTADEVECRRYYENNQTKFLSPDLYEPAHILLSADARDEPRYARALEAAREIITLLSDSPEKFEAIARERSDCPSAKDGGRLGQVTIGQTTPEFETFMRALEPGQLCQVPVKTPYGVHILRLERKIAGNLLPYEFVRRRIATYLEQASERRAKAQFITILAGHAQIEGAKIGTTTSPLVQ